MVDKADSLKLKPSLVTRLDQGLILLAQQLLSREGNVHCAHLAHGVESVVVSISGVCAAASANPACKQYQPASSDLLDSGYPPSSAYHASSPAAA